MNPFDLHGIKRNEDDLILEGVSLKGLTDQYPTPLYIYNQSVLENHLAQYRTYFKDPYFKTRIFYASKAFNIKAVLKLVNSFGIGVDVVSMGELYTALQAGVEKNDILFHGNNKSNAELAYALDAQIGTIVLDNVLEADRLIEIEKEKKTPVDVLIRINPGIEAHTHEYVVTAHVDSKFGISILEMETLTDLCKKLQENEWINFKGFHCHIGSQIMDLNAFRAQIEKLAGFVKEFESISRIPVTVLDLGGGFASWYTEKDTPPTIEETCSTILKACNEKLRDTSIDQIWIEPGRSVVANAGITLYTIGDTKKTPNRQYYFIDGGMADNIRPALYQSEYTCAIVENEKNPSVITIAGKACESGDIIARDIELAEAKPGDHLLTFTTGAYGYSMASNYNKLPIPAVLFIKDGKVAQVVKPQTLEDLIRNESDELL